MPIPRGWFYPLLCPPAIQKISSGAASGVMHDADVLQVEHTAAVICPPNESISNLGHLNTN